MRQNAFLCLIPFAAAAPAYAADGMPQMDPTWYVNGFVWLAVSFLALYLAVSRRIVPSIAGVLATRDEAISGAIREAEKARVEAESARSSGLGENKSALLNARDLVARAQAEASAESAEALAKLDRELTKRLSNVTAVLEEAVAKAHTGVDAAAQELAQSMLAKLTMLHPAQSEAPKLKLAK